MNSLKRSLNSVDEEILASALVKEGKDGCDALGLINRVHLMETYLDNRITQEKRLNLPTACEAKINKCILRMFFHHSFIAATETEGSHFRFVCEGIVIQENGDKSGFNRNIFKHLQTFRIQTDKKHILSPQNTFEWTEKDLPRGVQAQAIHCKLPAEKPGIIRITFHLNHDYCPKFKLSNELKALFPSPNIVESSEEECCQLILQYIASHALFTDKDRRCFLCDEILKTIFGMELMYVYQIRSKLAIHLLPPDAIEFEYYLNPVNTPDFIQNIVM